MSLVKITDHLFLDPDNISTVMDDMTNNGEPVPGVFIMMKNNQQIGVVGATLNQVVKKLGYVHVDRV